MPWKRGTGSVEVELSNVQSWIEQTDRVLNGENGEKGLIRIFQTDKDKQAQRDEDMMRLFKIIVWVFGPTSALGLLLSLLRAIKVIP